MRVRVEWADGVRLSLAAGMVVLVAGGDFGGAFELLVALCLTLIPRLMRVAHPFDLGFAFGMSLQAWGNVLGLFERYGWYDTVVHFTLAAVAAPTAYLVLVRLGVLPELGARDWARPHAGIVLIIFSIGAGFEAVWEVYEFVVDTLTGAHMQAGNADTVGDLAASALGALVGGQWLVALWSSATALPRLRGEESA